MDQRAGLSAMGNVSYLTFVVLGVAVPGATSLVVSLDVPAEPDPFVTTEIDELGPTTGAGLFVVDGVTTGLIVRMGVSDKNPPVGPPARI